MLVELQAVHLRVLDQQGEEAGICNGHEGYRNKAQFTATPSRQRC